MSKDKSGFKMPHIYLVFMMVMLLVVALSWVVPAGEFGRVQDPATGAMVVDPDAFSYVDAEPIGVLDYFGALHKGVVNAGDIIVMLLLASGAIQILNESGAMKAGIHSLLRISSGKEIGVLVILAFVFTLLGTIGLGEGGLPFIPLIVAVAVGLGFDRVTGYATYGAGMLAGFTAGVVNFYSTGVSQMMVGLPLYSGLSFRIVSMLIFFAIAAFYLVAYARKIKKDHSKSVMVAEYRKQLEEEKHDQLTEETLVFTARKKLALFSLIFVFFLNPFGAIKLGWMLPEFSANFVILAVLLAIILQIKPSDAAKTFGEGAAGILPAALAIGFANSVMVLMNQAKIVDTAVNGLAGVLQGQGMFMTLLLVFLTVVFFNFFVVSASGKALILMPILGPLAQLLGINQQVMVLLYQFGDGLTNQMWFTSGALMAGLAMVAISYRSWIKYVLKLGIVLHIVAFGLIYVAHLIGLGPF